MTVLFKHSPYKAGYADGLREAASRQSGSKGLLGVVSIEEEAHDCEEGCRYWVTIAGQRIGSPGNFTDINTVRDWLESIHTPNAENQALPRERQ